MSVYYAVICDLQLHAVHSSESPVLSPHGATLSTAGSGRDRALQNGELSMAFLSIWTGWELGISCG